MTNLMSQGVASMVGFSRSCTGIFFSWGNRGVQEVAAGGAGALSACSIIGQDTLVYSCRRQGACKRSPRWAGARRPSPITCKFIRTGIIIKELILTI